MLRKIMVVLAITVALGGFAPSGGAFAHGGDYTAGDGYRRYDGRIRDLSGGFQGYRRGDVWGHWGSYYGPMVPAP